MGFECAGAPEPPCVIRVLCFLSISCAPDPRIVKEFGIFTKSTMLNNLQSIVQENHLQPLNTPETDSAQYTCNHSGIERLSNQYWVDITYSKIQLVYFRLTWRIQQSISSLKNEVNAHLRSALLLGLMVPDSSAHTYSIQWLILTSSHSLLA